MQDNDFSSLNGIAKFTVNFLVGAKVNQFAQTLITDHTELEPDGIPVRFIGALTGGVVASRTRSYTDALVDKTQAWLAERQKSQSQTTSE